MVSGLPWGLALASGVNTYLPLFLLAVFARFTHIVQLSPRFQFLVSDQALILLGALAACEILAQKFPGLDNFWDFMHTLLRPLAGAVAAGAVLTTNSAFEMIVAMLLGATLSTAAHAAKSSVRLASTTKTLGVGNIFVSLAEDAAVIAGTLLSLYAPWIMLGIVALFVAAFAWFGPPLGRAVLFDLRILGVWLAWLFGRMFGPVQPPSLRESLLRLTPRRAKSLGGHLATGEDLVGALEGWIRTRRGPRPAWLVLTSLRVLVVERRWFGRTKVQAIVWHEIALALRRNLRVFERIELVTRQNERFAFNVRKTDARLGATFVDTICRASGIAPSAAAVPTPEPRLAPATH